MILRHSQENKILPWLESAVPGAILGLLLLQGCYSIRPPSTAAMDAALSSSPNVIYSRGEFLTLVAEPACGNGKTPGQQSACKVAASTALAKDEPLRVVVLQMCTSMSDSWSNTNIEIRMGCLETAFQTLQDPGLIRFVAECARNNIGHYQYYCTEAALAEVARASHVRATSASHLDDDATPARPPQARAPAAPPG